MGNTIYLNSPFRYQDIQVFSCPRHEDFLEQTEGGVIVTL